MSGVSIESLNLMNDLLDRLMSEENRDDPLIIEMCQAMISDLIATGELKPLADYIAHYTYLSRADAEEMATEVACAHRDISWHGSRGECQTCGKYVPILETDR